MDLETFLLPRVMSQLQCVASTRVLRFVVHVLFSSFIQLRTSSGPPAQWSTLSFAEFSKQKVRNIHSDTVSSSCWFGDCFLESCFALEGRIRVAFQPGQVSYYSSNFQKNIHQTDYMTVSRCRFASGCSTVYNKYRFILYCQ